ncbi:MAG TPA: hypothetical protein VJN63_04440 [Thermoplasmata archaeon]|nr:hypothetical protein [Thermoplasmata archaeon]
MHRPSIGARVRRFLAWVTGRFPKRLEEFLRRVWPYVCLALGVVLILLALLPGEALRVGDGISAQAPRGMTDYVVSPLGSPPYSVVLGTSSCDLAAFILNESAWESYLMDRSLPSEGLDCQSRSMTYADVPTHVVVRNSGTVDAAFLVEFRFRHLVYPLALLSIPGFAVVLLGVLAFSMRTLAKGIERLSAELVVDRDEDDRQRKV